MVFVSFFKFFRRRRFALFLNLMQPKIEQTLLDVGGCPTFWIAYPQPVARIDSLNLYEAPWASAEYPAHDIRILVGDGCKLAISNNAYDIAFSNSVIEHVGSWEQQKKFAAEIRRVASALWVQTPAFECPIEPHYMAPLIHFLPNSLQRFAVKWFTPWSWLERPTQETIDLMVDTTRLLKKKEMEKLFPDCEIITERFLWLLPKSYIAIRHQSSERQ